MSKPREFELEPTGIVAAEAAATAWYWFSFAYYYGSPAVLVEQEVCKR